jgi:hypothetical protein
VVLLDHHAGEEISAAVTAGQRFQQAFPAEVTEDLEGLRRVFRRKAFFKRQEQLLRMLPREQLRKGLRLGDLPDSPEARAYLAIRGELGLDCSPDAPVLTDPRGREVEDLETHLRQVRLMRVSMEANTALCRGLLDARYAEQGASR